MIAARCDQSGHRGRGGRRADEASLSLSPLYDRSAARDGGPELITGLLDQARRNAGYELRREARQMRTVGPRGRARGVA